MKTAYVRCGEHEDCHTVTAYDDEGVPTGEVEHRAFGRVALPPEVAPAVALEPEQGPVPVPIVIVELPNHGHPMPPHEHPRKVSWLEVSGVLIWALAVLYFAFQG